MSHSIKDIGCRDIGIPLCYAVYHGHLVKGSVISRWEGRDFDYFSRCKALTVFIFWDGSSVHGLNLVGVVGVDDRSAQLEGVGKFATLDGEFVRHEGELFDALKSCKSAL